MTTTVKPPCAADECSKPAHARGWCGTHYARWKRLGTVELTPYVTPECVADDCPQPAYSNGFCLPHYQRMRKRGSLDLLPVLTLPERFAANYVVDAGGCWLWQGSIGLNGYGRMSVSNRLTYAHRVAYELHVGPIPEGLTVDHLCRVRACVRPDHLEPVTRAENTRREAAARKAL